MVVTAEKEQAMSNFKRNALSVVAIAALTMTATLAVVSGGSVGAEDDELPRNVEELKKVTPEIVQPTLSNDDCSFKLTMDKDSYKEGDTPVLSVEITNHTEEEITRSVEVHMKTRDLMERSRMPSVAAIVWKKSTDVTLAAGETRTIDLKPDVKIAPFQSVSFDMKHAEDAVVKEIEVKDVNKAEPDVMKRPRITN